MKFPRIAALCVLIYALAVLPVSHPHAAHASIAAPADGEKKAASASGEDSRSSRCQHTLFPGLSESAIAALSIVTPEQRFEFRCKTPQNISVNGKQADEQIFSTLVSQIRELPVCAAASFSPENTPSMTMIISTRDGGRHCAQFYTGASGLPAHIASGPEHAPVYHQTEAWRIGTMIMTCEGTRIQDASGNELPAVIP